MKTWQAILAHMAVGALQVGAGTSFFGGTSLGGSLANTGIQLGIQTGLLALQGWLANKNSKSDPNGAPLVQGVGGGFQSIPKPHA